ncbi:MAG TPA: nuclear transport factor 2 family protein [Gemmatimonadales bacterium]|nr:nuclear transport factor 2 family protein [Gemmatimonadales bacterium]
MNRGGFVRAAATAVLVLAGGCVASGGRSAAPAPTPGDARRGVLALLAHGAAAWTRGDLDAFVSDYAPEASFVTPRGVLHGRAEIRAHYAPRFAPGAPRDSLYFQDLEVDLLAPDALNAVAYYVLQRGDSVVARGPTSLVMRLVGGRWYMTHDHSS